MTSDRPGESEMDRTFAGLRLLVEKACGGDRAALQRLFELHEPMMLQWARRRLGQPLRTLDETRDVLHDAYQIVMRKITTFQMTDSRSFARWLRGIITRVVLRKAGSPHIQRRIEESEAYQPPDLELTPMSRMTIEELKYRRYRLLREFPREERLIYRLRVRGCSSLEIANRLGLSDRAVRMKFAKTDARIRLKMRLLIGGSPHG